MKRTKISASPFQMDLFPMPEVDFREKIETLKAQVDKMRRSFFKRYELYQKDLDKAEKDIQDLVSSYLNDQLNRVYDSGSPDTLERAQGL